MKPQKVEEQSLPIIYDYQIFQSQRFGGISRYFCEIINRLNCKYKIAIRFTTNYYLTNWHLCDNCISLPRFINKYYSRFFCKKNHRLAKKLLRSGKFALFHPTYYDPYFLKYLGTKPYVITVHDMTYEKLPHLFTSSEIIIQQKTEVITKANRIIAISENTKKDIVEIIGIAPEKIDVVYHGTSMKAFSGKYKLKLPQKYLLFVGDRTSYKNFQRFIEVFADLHEKDQDLYLVFTGSKLKEYEIRQLPPNLSSYMIHINASDKVLSELYTRALVFVYPSLYEGFGIPILEAYACHCPVAVSNTSCFPEIAGDAAVYFDPYSKESMHSAILKITYNEKERKRLSQLGDIRLKRYSWEEATRKTEKIYRNVIESNMNQ